MIFTLYSHMGHSSEEKTASWCMISMDGSKIKVKIKHIGRGKFKVVNDEREGKYSDSIVDASDVIHCL